jgi:hypothetical protein
MVIAKAVAAGGKAAIGLSFLDRGNLQVLPDQQGHCSCCAGKRGGGSDSDESQDWPAKPFVNLRLGVEGARNTGGEERLGKRREDSQALGGEVREASAENTNH